MQNQETIIKTHQPQGAMEKAKQKNSVQTSHTERNTHQVEGHNTEARDGERYMEMMRASKKNDTAR